MDKRMKNVMEARIFYRLVGFRAGCPQTKGTHLEGSLAQRILGFP